MMLEPFTLGLIKVTCNLTRWLRAQFLKRARSYFFIKQGFI
jgi:hypothetical protein